MSVLAAILLAASAALPAHHGVRVEMRFPASVHSGAITGRVYVILTKQAKPEPRIQVLSPESSPPFFAADVNGLAPGHAAVIDGSSEGFPLRSIDDLPAGNYVAEALVEPYVRYPRADGHTIWAPAQWGPQVFSLEPGDLYSATRTVHVDPKSGTTLTFSLNKVVSEKDIAQLLGGEGYDTDTPWIKHVRIQSPALTKFWGRPIYLGATVLLPKGYASHPNSRYPVVYNQGHYYQPVPWDFTTDRKTETPAAIAGGKVSGMGTGYEFYEAWNSPHFPRFLMVTFEHPCPFFDDSYAVNTANCGPFGDALMNELIPYVETHFRVLREARARFLEGGSTGGWESLAMQVQHPKFFGGAYVFDPDPIDFSAFQMVNLYNDKNAFWASEAQDPWHAYPRPWERTSKGQALSTNQDLSQYELAMGSNGRSGYQLDGWWAIFDPAGAGGYPKPMWNMRTGVIDPSVAAYARANGYDLTAYMKSHWSQIGPDLVGKLHFVVGDMDNYFLNLAVYKAQEALDGVTNPRALATFTYGRPMKGHGWHPMTWAALLQDMARDVRHNTPAGVSNAEWNY